MELDLPISDVIAQFAFVVAAALLVLVPLERSRIPGITGLLLLGMLVGPGGLALLPREPVVELLGSVGLLYIMFLAGLEIDLDTIRDHKREAVTFGLLSWAFTLVPVVGIALLVGTEWSGAILVGAALSSHTLVSYPVIDRLRLVQRRPIVAAIGGTLLSDTLALVLLAILVSRTAGNGWGALGSVAPLLSLAMLAAASLAFIPRLSAFIFNRTEATAAERALFLLAVLLLLAVAADIIGTEDILGAFLAGVCLNRAVHARKELHEHIEFVGRMLFIPFFFVDTGMRLELVILGNVGLWGLAALLLAVVLAGKSAAAWLAGYSFGYSALDRLAVAGLTFPQAAATLAVMVVGRQLDLVGEELMDAVIIVIFVTCLAGPLLTRVAGKRLARRQNGQAS